jgi:hypothetical protein
MIKRNQEEESRLVKKKRYRAPEKRPGGGGGGEKFKWAQKLKTKKKLTQNYNIPLGKVMHSFRTLRLVLKLLPYSTRNARVAFVFSRWGRLLRTKVYLVPSLSDFNYFILVDYSSIVQNTITDKQSLPSEAD